MKLLQLFNELRRHGKLAEKRHPMYDTNRFGKYAMRVGAVSFAAYLIFMGSMSAIALSGESREAYHLMGGGFIIFLIVDFLFRIPMQKTPTQEIKPYLLMPVKRNRVIDFLLIRSALDGYNFFWLFLFAPFAILTVTKFYGIVGVLCYCLGVWLLTVFNNYWFLLCKTLIGEHIAWSLLPAIIYGAVAAVLFIPDDGPVLYGFMYLSDAFVKGDMSAYLSLIAAIILLVAINRSLMARLFYNEVNKVEDVKVKASDYNFFERYGEIGEYMRLELKMILRNKTCKTQMRMTLIVVIAFSLILSFSDIYDGGMRYFITVYNFSIFGIVYLSNIMSFEGNYIDGLMSRKESILTLLLAKYIFYSLAIILPAILMIPTVAMGKISLCAIVACALFSAGPMYCLLFQLAVYNKKTTPLNAKLSGRQNMGTGTQNLITFGAFLLPLSLYRILSLIVGDNVTNIIISLVGLTFIVTHKYWIRSVYRRFMTRRYENMAGFRDSRV